MKRNVTEIEKFVKHLTHIKRVKNIDKLDPEFRIIDSIKRIYRAVSFMLSKGEFQVQTEERSEMWRDHKTTSLELDDEDIDYLLNKYTPILDELNVDKDKGRVITLKESIKTDKKTLSDLEEKLYIINSTY